MEKQIVNAVPKELLPRKLPDARMRTQNEIDQMPGEEMLEKRTASGKLYSLGENLFQAVLYGSPVHYKDKATGEWREIDNTLVEERNNLGEVRLVNKQNGLMKVALGTGQKMVEVTNENDETISWTIEGAKSKAKPVAMAASLMATSEKASTQTNVRGEPLHASLSQEADYEDVFPGMQMRCHVGSASFKEDIIFSTQSAVKPVVFLIQAPNLTLHPLEDGGVSILNDKQETAFTMPAPFMIDNEGATGSVSVDLAKKNATTWQLTYTPDAQWLETAAFPVTLDPAIFTAHRSEWGYVDSAAPTTAYPSTGTYPATNMNGRRRLLYLRFGKSGTTSSLPQIDASYAVTSAVLSMPSRANTGKVVPLHLREVLSDWTPSALTYTNQPTVSQDDVDLAIPTTEGRLNYEFNIASLVQKWHTGENYGVVIDAREEGADILSYGSELPMITVTYAGQAGLEDYFTMESHSIGRAGTAHVNLFNGNLVFAHANTSMSGSRMPVSLAHYYNSCYRDLDIFSAGYGWKHSMHKAMHLENGYYVYTDGDGTRHNFVSSSKSDPYRWTSQEDTSGLGLRLAVDNSYATMYDKGDDYIRFAKPTTQITSRETRYNLMLESADAHGNKVTVKTVNKNVSGVNYPNFETITDGAGRVTALTTNARGYVERIKPPYETNGLSFLYDPSGVLTQITYEDGLTTQFTYDSLKLLTSVTNHDGRKLVFEYESHAPYRVKRVTEFGGEVTGNCREYTYGHLTTTVTDCTMPGGKQMFYAFNASGNLISTHDLLGQAMMASFAPENMPNHPKSVSKQMRAVINRLRNHGFETSKHWLLSGPARFEARNQQMGERCLCFDSGIAGGAMQAAQTLNLTPGTSYVFSFYAKTCGMMTLRAAIEYQDDQGVKQTIESPALNTGSLYEYERLHFAFALPYGSAQTVTVMIRGLGEAGVPSRAWIDSAQLEDGVLPNRYNLLINGDFTFDCAGRPLDWLPTSDTTLEDVAYIPDDMIGKPDGLTGRVLKIHGGTQKVAGYSQEILISGHKGDVFLTGGWARGFSASNKNNKKAFALHIAFKNEDGEYVDAEPISWAHQRGGWQFTCGASVASTDYTSVRLHLDYEKNINAAEFDGLFMHREHFGQSFDYDSNGNVLSVQQLTGKKSAAEYDPHNNLISYRNPGHPKSEITRVDYGITDAERRRHLPRKITSPSGLTQSHTYDAKGNRLTSTTIGPDTSDFIKSSVTYATNENYPSSMTDARGKTVTQDIDPVSGVLRSATDPSGQTVQYTYDALRRATATTTTADGKTYRNAYTYTDDKLASVAHNTTDDNVCDVAYTFAFDALGNQTTVEVGEQALSTNVYTDTGDKLLKRTEYGNGGKVHYERDAYKRLVGVAYDEEAQPRYRYDYDASGGISRATDDHLGTTSTFDRDFADRPGRLCRMSGDEHLYTQEVSYDGASRVSKVREQIGEEKTPYMTEYAYDSEGRLTEILYDIPERGIKLRYDSLGRLALRKLLDDAEAYLTNYEYAPGGQGAGSTTGLIQSVIQPGQNFGYLYDDLGNIVRENHNGLETTYVYDGLSQLIRVNDPHRNKTIQYEYDRGGNILSRTEHPYTTGTPGQASDTASYTYGDANWKDKLTAYNGTPITYDEIGNPLDDGTWTYTWKVGRQLARMTGTGDTVDFTYNADGLRVRKESTVRGVTEYTLSGKRITHLTRKENGPLLTEMHFWYDAQGKAAMVSYNGNDYVYVYNAQGDVVALLDKANHHIQVVEYAYDPWGKQVACTGTMANTLGVENPFRYRGYVFDVETGLYATATRCYNPEWGRWLNADILLGKIGAVVGHNLFTYCLNDPVNMSDSTGLEPVLDYSKVQAVSQATMIRMNNGVTKSGKTKVSAVEGEGYIYIPALGEKALLASWKSIGGGHLDIRFNNVEDQERIMTYLQSMIGIEDSSLLKDGEPVPKNMGAWEPVEAYLGFNGVVVAGSVNLILHSGSGDGAVINRTGGNLCFYTFDSKTSNPVLSKTVKEHRATAVEALSKVWEKYAKYDSTTNGKWL